jgi:hypothetical protein
VSSPLRAGDESNGREAAAARPTRAAPEVAVLKRKGVGLREVDVLKAKLASSAPVCRIEWSRVDGKSTFCAKHTAPDGSWSVLERSRPFRWSKSKPPPQDLPHVAEAYEALLARLQERGWVATRCRGDWFAVEMERRPAETAGSARKGER